MRTLLLAVTGMSPQVITETLWAIHERRGHEPWPAEIQLITTRPGGEKALEGLVRQGHLASLCAELGMPVPLFGAEQIHIVPGDNGMPVDDARSREDHEALADFIMRKVAELARQEGIRIHASLAGGRKTMTYYFGYAMSLFGRAHDTLSHVLVSEGYEGLSDFYYPGRTQPPIFSRDGRALKPSDAEVVLADIPFVRMSETLSPAMRELAASMTFRQLVVLLNLASQPQTVKAEIDIGTQQLHIGNRSEQKLVTITIKSKPVFALFVVLLRAHQEHDHSIQRKQINAASGKEIADRGLAGQIVDELLVICGVPAVDGLVKLEDKIEKLKYEYAELKEPSMLRTLDTIRDGVKSGWLDPKLTNLRQQLEAQLPLPLAGLFCPVGMKVDQDGKLTEAKGDEAAYRFRLAPEQFVLLEAK